MTIPKKIYLQIVDDEGNELDPMKDEVTWCWDKINDNDVEYEIVPTKYALDAAMVAPAEQLSNSVIVPAGEVDTQPRQ